MDFNSLIKKKVVWGVVGSIGFVGMMIAFLALLLIFVLFGALVSLSDSSGLKGIPLSEQEVFNIPAHLLPIYLQAENEAVSWASLAAIHQVTTHFGIEKSKRLDSIGCLGFPRPLWEMYKVDGDRDGMINPDNPYDAIYSLANVFRWSGLNADQLIDTWFLDANDAVQVRIQEMAYEAVLFMPQNWLWPVLGYSRVSSFYGFRTDPVTGIAGVFHDGIDIPAPRGMPVVAIQEGDVMEVSSGGSYGNMIRLRHEGNNQSIYGHLSKVGVQRGQRVLRGEVIGLVGSTGKSTGPHLHLGMLQNGQSVDPLTFWIKPMGQ